MKKVTNLLAAATVAVAILFGSTAKAQTTTSTAPVSPWRLGFGVEGGIPTGNIHDYSKFELGGTARLQYGLNSNTDLTLTSGYYNFFPTSAIKDAGGKSIGIVPVKVGIKYFVAQNIYVAGEAGAGFETKYAKNTKLILSPGVGYADEHWDVGVRYENFSGQSDSYGLVALRLAYGFRL